MAAVTYENQSVLVRSRIDWGAIWGGVFTFLAIWSVFGVLGLAVFASSGSPNAARPFLGMGLGMSIWAIVLTIIAMYVAGVETGRLAEVSSRHDGMLHGMAMFGLSLAGALVIVVLGGIALNTGAQPTVHSTLMDTLTGFSWASFLSIFLGWLAAMGGASSAAMRKIQPEKPVQQIRNAA